MSSNKLKVQAFRANDLSGDTGKQFEFGRSWCDFLEIDNSVGDITFNLLFKPLSKAHENLKDHKIEFQLSPLTIRNDRKAYANGAKSGHSAIKEFFLEDLHLTSQNNSSDYFAIYKTSEHDYYLYYIPQLLHDNFIRFFKSITPKVTISRSNEIKTEKNQSLQQIYYGTPGTGKSHEIKEKTKDESVIRTTFHPDSDYSTFVGAYKPVMEDVDVQVVPVVLNNGTSFDQNKGNFKEKRIAYKFVIQAFLKAYLGAWKKYTEAIGDEVDPQFLIIEEINRGNCAQIFGDLFQLLDRGDNGFSEYPIEADNDLQREIERAFMEHKDYKLKEGVKINAEGVLEDYTSNYGATLSEDIQSGRVLLLPPNLYIWATMNTSDQSLFPIDSAFKRRWDWVYMPIGYKNNNWIIEIGVKKYYWVDFQHKINESIYDVDNSEDKQLGDYFVNADRTDGKISADTLLNKILFYIWNDVCKDDPDQIFQWIDDKQKSIKFSEFFGEDRDKKLQGFMAFHKVPAIGESTNADNSEENETNETPAEDNNEVNS